ncbi:hypothetical protein BpHYR1_049269 [Brachionus plicatilis]|uniref:Uncharacterized protein n=1 Tax=Brachionus plicatilis TaxID=10195 RepID=A0A3M7R6D3_BRAPC|nr:hypothetical protein BpHYR1_049269 [Brachionus plicatilis]
MTTQILCIPNFFILNSRGKSDIQYLNIFNYFSDFSNKKIGKTKIHLEDDNYLFKKFSLVIERNRQDFLANGNIFVNFGKISKDGYFFIKSELKQLNSHLLVDFQLDHSTLYQKLRISIISLKWNSISDLKDINLFTTIATIAKLHLVSLHRSPAVAYYYYYVFINKIIKLLILTKTTGLDSKLFRFSSHNLMSDKISQRTYKLRKLFDPISKNRFKKILFSLSPIAIALTKKKFKNYFAKKILKQ